MQCDLIFEPKDTFLSIEIKRSNNMFLTLPCLSMLLPASSSLPTNLALQLISPESRVNSVCLSVEQRRQKANSLYSKREGEATLLSPFMSGDDARKGRTGGKTISGNCSSCFFSPLCQRRHSSLFLPPFFPACSPFPLFSSFCRIISRRNRKKRRR